MPRLNWSNVAPEGAKALYSVHHYVVNRTSLPAELIHLVFLRVSQINGCAHCIDLHSRDLRKTMSVDKIALVPVWDEVGQLFSEMERAALAWAEEVTRVSDACLGRGLRRGVSSLRTEGSRRPHDRDCCNERLQPVRRAISSTRRCDPLRRLAMGRGRDGKARPNVRLPAQSRCQLLAPNSH